MTYLLTVCVYTCMSYALYVGPVIALILAGFLVDAQHRFIAPLRASGLFVPLEILGVCVLFGLLALAHLRARMAAEAYAAGDAGFWGAFAIAGARARVSLGRLPVIGRVFRRRSD